MTKEGRLQRGKENYEHKNKDGTVGKFLNNSETLEYIASMKKPETAKEKKAREAAEAKAAQEAEDGQPNE